MLFDFENFPVYKDAIKFIQEVDDFLESVPQKGNLRIIDQLQRASTSIALNIAEGAGRYHKTDKRNFYVMARGSVYESAACFQIFMAKKLINSKQYEIFYKDLNNLARQLSAMIK